jgi:hypothetical protein
MFSPDEAFEWPHSTSGLESSNKCFPTMAGNSKEFDVSLSDALKQWK